MKKALIVSLITFLCVEASAQSSTNFFLNNVNSVVHNYSSAYIENNTNDPTIKHSIVVSATGGKETATFILYFGDNQKEAEIITVSTNVYTVRSWHKIDEYGTLSELLKNKGDVGIGYFNKFGSLPNRVILTKSAN